MERSSGEIEDTSETVRSQHALRASNPEPIHMPEQTHLSESLFIPKPAVSPPKTSTPMEVPPLKESRETTFSKEPESSFL